jgi:ribose transport system substrate-binding protein
MTRKGKALLACVALVLGALPASAAFADGFRIAFFASSAQNGFNQAVYKGIVERAKEIGGVETAIYDGQFDAAKQYSQIEDVLAGNRFDAFIVVPNDTVGIAGAVEQAAGDRALSDRSRPQETRTAGSRRHDDGR